MATSDVLVKFGGDATELQAAAKAAVDAVNRLRDATAELGPSASAAAGSVNQCVVSLQAMINVSVNLEGVQAGLASEISALADGSARTNLMLQKMTSVLEDIGAATSRTSLGIQQMNASFAQADSAANEQVEAVERVKSAHSGLSGSFGNTQIALMEVGHSVRAFIDSINAGIPAQRAFLMEAPRLGEAFLLLPPQAMAAAAAIAAVGAALYETVGQALMVQSSIQNTANNLALFGRQGEMSKEQIRALADQLNATWKIGEAAAAQTIEAWSRLPHMASDTALAFGEIAAGMARAKGTDVADEQKELSAALERGVEGIRQYLSSYNRMTAENQKALNDAKAQNSVQAAFNVLIGDTKNLLAQTGDAWRKYREEQAAAQLAKGAQAPRGLSEGLIFAPTPAPKPETQQDRPAISQQDQEALTTAEKAASVEQQIAALAAQKEQLTAAANAERAKGDAASQEALQKYGAALDEVNLKLRQTHTPVDAEQHAKTMANLQQQLAAADQDYAKRVQVLQQIAEATKKYEGEGSSAAIQAQTAVENAQRQSAQNALQIKIASLRQQQAADADNRAKVLADEDQILAAYEAAGRKGTTEYAAELDRRAQIQREKTTQELAEWLDAQKKEITAEQHTTQEREALLIAFDAQYKAKLADHTALFKQAKDFELDETKRVEDAKRAAVERGLNDQIRAQEAALSAKTRAIETEVSLGLVSQQQATAATVASLQQQYNSTLWLYEGKRELAGQSASAQKEIDDQEAAATARYNDAILAQAEKAAVATENSWTRAIEPINRAMDQSIQGIMQGNQTASQALTRAAGSIAASYASSGLKMATDWLKNQILMTQETEVQSRARALIQAASSGADEQTVQAAVRAYQAAEVQQTAATQAGAAQRNAVGATENAGFLSRMWAKVSSWFAGEEAQTGATAAGAAERAVTEAAAADTTKAINVASTGASITSKAADAAAGAYEATVDIPIVGPILAPVAAATAFTAVMAYKMIASAEGGWGEVPYDGAPAILHKQEMVLPASIATPLRNLVTQKIPQFGLPPLGSSMMAAPAAGGGGGGGGGASTVNHNYSINVSALDSKSFQSFIKSGGGDVIVQHLQNKRRNFGM